MTKELKEEVKELIAAAIGAYHQQNVERLTAIEKRLIGIDGNGTGNRGVLQQMGETLDETKNDVKTIREAVSKLTISDTTWNKEKMLKGIGWFVVTFIAAAGVLLAGLTYWHSQHPGPIIIGTKPAVTQSYNSETR